MASLFAAAAAPLITIELPTALTWVLGIIAALIATIGFFLHRELKSNDAAHAELRGDAKKLLTGDVEWVKAIRDDIREIRRGLGHG